MDRTITIQMRDINDAQEMNQAQEQRTQFDRNSQWLQENIADIYAKHRGKCICIAGQEVFVADTAQAAIAQAKAIHPQDKGWFTRYIPLEKQARIYEM